MSAYFSNVYPTHLVDELRSFTSKSKNRTITFPKFFFLCGKAKIPGKKTNRDWILDYLKRNGLFGVVPVLSEKLWEIDSSKSGLDLLSFEDFLAEASDAILLFVESYGTACELGAFSMKNKLVDKLIVFNDKNFLTTKSFINDGPIRKIKNTNNSNAIYTDLNAIFSNVEVTNKLKEITSQNKRLKINEDINHIQLNSFIVEILELISILQPIKKADLPLIYKTIKRFSTRFNFSDSNKLPIRIQFSNIYELLESSNLICEQNDYLSIKGNLPHISFMFDLNSYQFNQIRAKFLSRKYKYDSDSLLKKVN